MVQLLEFLILETLAPTCDLLLGQSNVKKKRGVLYAKGEIKKENVLLKFIHKINITYQNGLSKLMMSVESLQPEWSQRVSSACLVRVSLARSALVSSKLARSARPPSALEPPARHWLKQEMSLKKTNGVELKKTKKILLHKSYTNDRNLRIIIVKDQWTAILANFVRK